MVSTLIPRNQKTHLDAVGKKRQKGRFFCYELGLMVTKGSEGSVILESDIVDVEFIEMPRGRQVGGSPEEIQPRILEVPAPFCERAVSQVEITNGTETILKLHEEWKQASPTTFSPYKSLVFQLFCQVSAYKRIANWIDQRT